MKKGKVKVDKNRAIKEKRAAMGQKNKRTYKKQLQYNARAYKKGEYEYTPEYEVEVEEVQTYANPNPYENDDPGYVYGKNAVSELLDSNVDINKVWVDQDVRSKDMQEIVQRLKDQKVVTIFVQRAKLDSMQENNQGIIASINPFEYTEIEDLVEYTKTQERRILIILDKIEDPHNLGAIIRSAEAAGVCGIIIPKRNAAGVNPLTYKTSAGAVSHIKISRVNNIVDTIKYLKKNDIWVIGTHLEAKEYYFQNNLLNDIAIVIGNEQKGMSKLVTENCDKLVKIPMIGQVQSLNASVSAGILIYDALTRGFKL